MKALNIDQFPPFFKDIVENNRLEQNIGELLVWKKKILWSSIYSKIWEVL